MANDNRVTARLIDDLEIAASEVKLLPCAPLPDGGLATGANA